MSRNTISSTTSSSTAKVPIFAAKAGFVIPKNKLSGSLVPILRRAKKPGIGDAFNGETSKHSPRKTKWGSDLSKDPAVRKGRALAYQTRVDQIMQQLKSGISDIRDGDDLALAAQSPDHESSGYQIDSEKTEQLELEKREAIGEILQLNPSYKAPSDYKPLLKEDRVFIPLKEYPGYNFVGLIFGPGGDNQKQLEKETGAKIQVYGIKKENGQKVEIKPTDSNDFRNAYEELYAHVSADTFEKVDAAISVIELLITSVSGNLAAASATSMSAVANDAHISMGQEVATPGTVHDSMMQPMPRTMHTIPHGRVQFPGQWFPAGPHNTALRPSPGFTPPPNSSALALNNAAHVPPLPFRPSNMHSPFGRPPVPVVGFNSPQNLAQSQQPVGQAQQHQYLAQANPVSNARPGNPSPTAVQPNNVAAPSMGITRPYMPSLPQPGSSLQPGAIFPASAGFSMTQMAPRISPSHGLRPVVPQPNASSTPLPSNIPTSTFMNAPQSSPGFPSLPPPVSGNVANFTPLEAPSLKAPNSGNFNFQPQDQHNPASQTVPRPISNQFMNRNAPPSNSMLHQPPAAQPPSLQFPGSNFTPHSLNHSFPRPLVGNNMGQPQTQPHISSVPFSRNPSTIQGPSGFPGFSDAGNGPRNFSQVPIFPSAFTPRQGNPVPHHQFNNHRPFTPGRPVSTPGEQLYDPFSPTSMPITPQQHGGIRRL